MKELNKQLEIDVKEWNKQVCGIRYTKKDSVALLKQMEKNGKVKRVDRNKIKLKF